MRLRSVVSSVGQILGALVLWQALVLVSGTEAPVAVIVSGSMEPAMHRGDIIFVARSDAPYAVGDVVLFRPHGGNRSVVPIVHRVVAAARDAPHRLLTKGDANWADDRHMYAPGTQWLAHEDVAGRVYARIPYVGTPIAWLNEVPGLKVAVIAATVLYTLVSDP